MVAGSLLHRGCGSWRRPARRSRTLPDRLDLFGVRERNLRAIRRRSSDAPIVEIVFRRPPDRVDQYEQELLVDQPDLKITLQIQPPGAPPVAIAGGVSLQPGAMLVWYLFPGEPFEIGSFHDREGRLLGQYVNVVRPSTPVGARWTVDDLFLDIWLTPGYPPRVLDEDEFETALSERSLPAEDGRVARRALDEILARIRSGTWPPEAVKRWPLDLVTALRLRRDSPGTYYSALISGRIIAWGLYLMGAVSATSIGFAAFTDAFVVRGASQTAWFLTLGAEALLLLPLTLGGRLPATRWPQPALTDERSLFIATLATGLAVMALNERASWSAAFLPVYGTLGMFSLIFAVCRVWFDRVVPIFALAGLIVTGIALAILL